MGVLCSVRFGKTLKCSVVRRPSVVARRPNVLNSQRVKRCIRSYAAPNEPAPVTSSATLKQDDPVVENLRKELKEEREARKQVEEARKQAEEARKQVEEARNQDSLKYFFGFLLIVAAFIFVFRLICR